MVKYKKRVENWWSYVPKRTNTIVVASHSEHVFTDDFTDDYSRH